MDTVTTAPDGSFIVEGLTPGRYVLQSERHGQSTGEFGSVTVDMYGLLEGTLVQMARGARVSGRVIVDPTEPDLDLASLSVGARTRDSQVRLRGLVRAVGHDGTFSIDAPPGTIAIQVLGLPPGWIVHSVVVGGVDVREDGVHTQPGQALEGIETHVVPASEGLVLYRNGDAEADEADLPVAE